MAIDTLDKRAAGVGFAAPYTSTFPTPDSSAGDLADRQILLYNYPILSAASVFVEPHQYLYWNGTQIVESDQRYIALVDGVPEPDTVSGYGILYIDSTSGDLKIKFGDGFVATVAADS